MENAFNKVTDNEKLMEELSKVTTPDEFAEALEKNGMQLDEGLTREEAYRLFDAARRGEGTELSEEDLEKAAGGFVLTVPILLGGIAVVIIGGQVFEWLGNRRGKKIRKFLGI